MRQPKSSHQKSKLRSSPNNSQQKRKTPAFTKWNLHFFKFNGKCKKWAKNPYYKGAPSKLLIIELLGIVIITYKLLKFNLF